MPSQVNAGSTAARHGAASLRWWPAYSTLVRTSSPAAMRLMFWAFGTDTVLDGIDTDSGTIALPGVVTIDEIDAHLHPAWQQRIGDWFVARFPEMQFLVTTHSPIICRAARPARAPQISLGL